MTYSYSFSKDFDQQWLWTERYAPQSAMLASVNPVADRCDLRSDIHFETEVKAAVFDETGQCWNKDPVVAELLLPKDLPLGTQRRCMDTGYYATCNRANATLVDIHTSPSKPSPPTICVLATQATP